MKKYLVLIILGGLIYFYNKEDRKVNRNSDTREQVEDFSSTSPTPNKSKQKSLAKQSASSSVGQVFVNAKSLEKITTYLECYESDKCDYPNTDPKSYQIALNKDVSKFLKQINYGEFAKNLEMQKALQSLMKQGDGFVQEEALKLFGQLPISQENLKAILEGTKNNYADPLIMEQVVAELARYKSSSMEGQVRAFVAETLLSGPQYSAEKAAQKIRPLLSEGNINYYRSIAEKTKSTAVRGSLDSSINDYTLSLSGG